MPAVVSDGVRISYRIIDADPEHPAVVCLHGWSASSRTNFDAFGWVDALKDRFRLVLIDFRGHGSSGKPLHSAAYSNEQLAADVVAVLDAERIHQPLLLGYSTGAQVAVELLARWPGRFAAGALCGIGSRNYFGWGRRFIAEDGLARPRFDLFPPRQAAMFLHWLHNNPIALAEAWRGLYCGRPPVDLSRANAIREPVVIATGTRDGYSHSAAELAAAIAGAELVWISGRNHVTTLGDRRLKQEVMAFFGSVIGEQPRAVTAFDTAGGDG